jgi:integrase
VVAAGSRRELEALLGEIDSMRVQLRLGLVSDDEIDRKLRRLRAGPVTVARAGNSLVDAGECAARTAKRVRWFLNVPGLKLSTLQLDALEAPMLVRWESGLRSDGYAQSSIATAWRTLRQIVRFAAARGWVSRTPWGSWRPSARASGAGRAPREAARDTRELVELFDAARRLDVRRASAGRLPDLEAKCMTTALLGLRQGELAGLRWPDVDAVHGRVTIERQYTGEPLKTKRVYELAALPELFEVLEQHRALLERWGLFVENGPVFPMRESERGLPRHYAASECLTRGDLRAVVRHANLPHPYRWSPHSLRDSFVTLEALSHGGDLDAVAERSRHSSIASLVRYLRSRTREPAPPGFTLPAGSHGPALARLPAGRSRRHALK